MRLEFCNLPLLLLLSASFAYSVAQQEEPQEEPPVVPEKEKHWNFDEDKTGSLPEGWRIESTNSEKTLAQWEIHNDASAPSSPNVLALIDAKGHAGSTYNLLWTNDVAFLNGSIEVKIKADSGEEDQGGGVIWRALDAKNYYVARWNPLEENFRAYYVKDSKRVELASAEIKADKEKWHTLQIVQQGTHIQGFFDGGKRFEFDDKTFLGAGGIGLWTKADAASSFDDLALLLD